MEGDKLIIYEMTRDEMEEEERRRKEAKKSRRKPAGRREWNQSTMQYLR